MTTIHGAVLKPDSEIKGAGGTAAPNHPRQIARHWGAFGLEWGGVLSCHGECQSERQATEDEIQGFEESGAWPTCCGVTMTFSRMGRFPGANL
jgi:hypothetical protein